VDGSYAPVHALTCSCILQTCLLQHLFLQGIKVVDAESKRAVLDLLKQEQAEKLMEVDESAAAAAKASADGSSSKKKSKKRSKVKLVTKTMTGTTSKKGSGAAAMED
jgi:hypothetical protein